MIGEKWGRVLNIDHDDEGMNSLTFARILVRTKIQISIDAHIKMEWETGSCVVWVKETRSWKSKNMEGATQGSNRTDLVVPPLGENIQTSVEPVHRNVECDGNDNISSNILEVSETIVEDGSERNVALKEVEPCVEKIAGNNGSDVPHAVNLLADFDDQVLRENCEEVPTAIQRERQEVESAVAEQVQDVELKQNNDLLMGSDPVASPSKREAATGVLGPCFVPLGPTIMNSWVSNTPLVCLSNKADSTVLVSPLVGSSVKRPRGRPKKNSLPSLMVHSGATILLKSEVEAQDTWNTAKLLGITSKDENAMVQQLRKSKRLLILDESRS